METTVVLHPKLDDIVRVYSKGAPEVLLQKCAIDEQLKNQLLETVVDNEMGANGIRPFAYAFKDMTLSEYEELSI